MSLNYDICWKSKNWHYFAHKKNPTQIMLYVLCIGSRWSVEVGGTDMHSRPAAAAVKQCLPCHWGSLGLGWEKDWRLGEHLKHIQCPYFLTLS